MPAPHAAHEKNQEFDRAPFGITGPRKQRWACACQFLHYRHNIPCGGIVELLSANPARVMKEASTLA